MGKRKINFEIFLTDNANQKRNAKNEIKKRYKGKLKPLFTTQRSPEEDRFYQINIRCDEQQAWEIAKGMIKIPGVLDVDPDVEDNSGDIPEVEDALTDGRPSPMWYHDNIKINAARKYALAAFETGEGEFSGTATGIKIAHFDTGYTNHPEIMAIRKDLGYNYVYTILDRFLSIFRGKPSRRDALDRLRNFKPFKWAAHGTATAGVIIGGNTQGIDNKKVSADLANGIFPHIDLIPYRISETIISFNCKMAHAAYQAIEDNCKIITMSHAGLLRKRSWQEAVRAAYEAGIIWVAAGGSHVPNFGRIWLYPARFPETIATAASTYENKPWGKTFSGKAIDISAPGFDMYIPYSRKKDEFKYRWSEGTSFSTPITAAAAAFWLAHHGENKLSDLYPAGWQRVEAFRRVLKDSCLKPTDWDPDRYGEGILDVEQLLKKPLPPADTLTRAGEPEKKVENLKTEEEFEDMIADKEITYLTCRQKVCNRHDNDRELYNQVMKRATVKTREKIERVCGREGEQKSELLKRHVKTFAGQWGY